MKKKTIYILIIFMIVLLIGNFAVSYFIGGGPIGSIQTEVLSGIDEINQSITNSFNKSKSYDELEAEIENLNSQLKMEEKETNELADENADLRESQGLPIYDELELASGEVIRKDYSGSQKFVTINIGSKNTKIEKGNAVIYNGELWGEITEVNDASSTAIIYADENSDFYIPATTDKEVNGEIQEYDYTKEMFVFKPLEVSNEVEVDTVIKTSEYSDNIPSGIDIGIVREVVGTGPNAKYYVEPQYDPYSAQFLSVVINE